jgi:hypothetical protein
MCFIFYAHNAVDRHAMLVTLLCLGIMEAIVIAYDHRFSEVMRPRVAESQYPMRTNGGETVSARVPGGRPAGPDQDTHAYINRVDTGTARCSEEADHIRDDMELPSAEAVLEIVLLPVDDFPSERRALRHSTRNRAKALLEAVGQVALPPRAGAVTAAVPA